MLDKLVDGLLESYDELCGVTPSSWIVFSSDFSQVNTNLAKICHAEMKYHPVGKYDELLTAVPRSSTESLSYLQGLVDGPFRQYKDLISLKQREGVYYFHVTGLDKFPAKALYNFCIATRVPIEFSENVQRWQHLVNLGVDPNLAYLISARDLTHGIPRWETKMNDLAVPSIGHWWFNQNSDWEPLIVGKITADTISYKMGPSHCTPTNKIWGEVDRDFYYRLRHMTIKKLQEHFIK